MELGGKEEDVDLDVSGRVNMAGSCEVQRE